VLQEINHAIINITMNNFVNQTEIMPVQFNEQCKIIKHTGNKHSQPYSIKNLLHVDGSHCNVDGSHCNLLQTHVEGSFCLTQQQREGYLE
jgi:hypothetical protein